MIRSRLRLGALSIAVLATGIGLAGCTTAADAEPPAADPTPTAAPSTDDGLAAGIVSEDCMKVSAYAVPHPDIADVAVPSDWPEPPEGSLLCATTETENAESAAYWSDTPIEDVLAYYAAALPSSYEAALATGEENGTGYDSLDGTNGEVGFMVRQNDAGFTLVFATGEDA